MDLINLKNLSHNLSRGKGGKDLNNYLLVGILVLSLIITGIMLYFKIATMKKKEKYEYTTIGGKRGLSPACLSKIDKLRGLDLSSISYPGKTRDKEIIGDWITKNC